MAKTHECIQLSKMLGLTRTDSLAQTTRQYRQFQCFLQPEPETVPKLRLCPSIAAVAQKLPPNLARPALAAEPVPNMI